MARRDLAVLALLSLLRAAAQAGEPGGQPGRLETVTLYRDQAAVTRLVPVPQGAGTLEVVVTELPERIDPESLHADGGEAVQIRSVRYRERTVRQEPAPPPQERLDQLAEQMRPLERALREVQQSRKLLDTKQGLLEKLAASFLDGAKEEMSKGFVETDQFSRFTLFVFEQHDVLAQRMLELGEQEQQLDEQLTRLRRQRDSLIPTAGPPRTVREAVVLLEKAQAAPAQLRLGYLVTHVGWTPCYNLRVAEGGPEGQVEVECNATVLQASGEDWRGVRLTLSTATPTLSSQAPQLTPFGIMLDTPPEADSAHDVVRLERERLAAEAQFRSADTPESRQQAEAAANSAAARRHVLLFRGAGQGQALERSEAPSRAPRLAVRYELAGPQGLPSREELQTLRIASLTLRGEFYRLAQPALTRHVYRQATLTNTSDRVLLPGRANAYVGGRFAGAGSLPQVRPGQRFTAGFGVDPRLTARQNLLARQEALKGGNKELTVTYNVVVENFSDQPLTVRVLDRYPLPAKDRIYVALQDVRPELSQDPHYTQRLKPRHLLRWDLDVPARATEDQARVIEYGFTIGFAKDLEVHPARTITPLFALLRPLEPWKVETDWSGDETKLAIQPAEPGQPERLTLQLTRGAARKNVIGRRAEGDLAGTRWLVVSVDNQIAGGTRLALGLSTGTKGEYFESTPNYIPKGEHPRVIFDLTAPNYKSEKTRWEYSDKARGLDQVRAVYLVFYPAAGGTVVVRSLTLAQ